MGGGAGVGGLGGAVRCFFVWGGLVRIPVQSVGHRFAKCATFTVQGQRHGSLTGLPVGSRPVGLKLLLNYVYLILSLHV